MNCPNCQARNPARARFCLNCGLPLTGAEICPACASPVIPGAYYCFRCGHALRESTAAPSAPLAKYIPKELLAKMETARAGRAMEGERRVVTMLFCDVKGSTAMAEKLDPEDWTEIMNSTFEHLIRPIYRYEGTLARLMGDAILAFFGAPIAHEDDPQRAVLAGLEISNELQRHRENIWEQWGMTFDVRVGINTGLVVVGEVGSDLRVEYTAMGDAVNLAARMEQTAQPGAVQIAESTFQLIKPYFECQALGGIEVKGKSQPVRAYRVLRAKAQRGRIRGIEGLSAPMIGRDSELAALGHVLDNVRAGHGHIVCILGEAGLGKSRLISELKTRWSHSWRQTTCVSYAASRPYGQYQQHLRAMCGIEDGDPQEAIRGKLTERLGQAEDAWLARALPIFELILGERGGGTDLPQGEAFQRALYAAALESQRRLSASGPAIAAVDDIHWIDPATSDLLIHLFQLSREVPTCFLCALRPDPSSAGWHVVESARRQFSDIYTEIALSPLSTPDSQALVAGLLADLPDKLTAHILTKTEGNPLFVEEVIRALIDSQAVVRDGEHWRVTDAAPSVAIPDSLRSLLVARIDRLDGEARRALQLAAVIGRQFSPTVLARIAEDDGLSGPLDTLEQADLIRAVSGARGREYVFRHALIQEAAYGSILLKRRRDLHRRVGDLLEEDASEQDAALLGFHFLEAGEYERAQHYHTQAADAAARLYANVEAAEHYGRAIEAARQGRGSSQELTDLYLRRASVQALAGSYDQALKSYSELHKLAAERADRPMLLAALIGEGTLRSTPTPAYDAALADQLARRALDLAQGLGDRQAEAKILWNLMLLSSFGDDPGQVVEYGEQALHLSRELGLKEQVAFTLNDLNRAYRAAGDLASSRAVLDESRDMWRAMGNLPMLTDNLGSSSYLCYLMGDYGAALAFGEEGYRVSLEAENLWGQAFNRSGMAFVQFESGLIEEGINGMGESVRVAEQFSMPLGMSAVRAELAWMVASIGQVERGLELGRQALQALSQSQLPPVIQAWTWAAYTRLQVLAGDFDGAEAALNRIPTGHGIEAPSSLAPIYAALARSALALTRGSAEAALAAADEIIARIRRWSAQGVLPEALAQRAGALAALGRIDEARQALIEAQHLAESESARRILREILLKRAHLEEAQGGRSIAANLRDQARQLAGFMADHLRDPEMRGSFRAHLAE